MNIGDTDRLIRIVVGVVLTGLALAGQIGVWGF
ncbi:MAG: YgaP-like transmembrane domain, partial [Iodobacter sp.]